MVVECRHLENLGGGKFEFMGQGDHMLGSKIMIAVLDQMKRLNQQVATSWRISKQFLNFLKCLRIYLSPSGLSTPLPKINFHTFL